MMSNLDNNKELIRKIEKVVSEISIPDSNQKAMLFSAFLQDAMSHFLSMNLLIEKKLYNSAFALVRVFFDTIIRGQYIVYILDDATINHMYTTTSDWQFLGTKKMCQDLDAHFGENIFDSTRNASYSMMCDYTHTGQTQIARHFNESTVTVEPNFDKSLIVDTLKGNYALMELFAKNYIAFMKSEGLINCELSL